MHRGSGLGCVSGNGSHGPSRQPSLTVCTRIHRTALGCTGCSFSTACLHGVASCDLLAGTTNCLPTPRLWRCISTSHTAPCVRGHLLRHLLDLLPLRSLVICPCLCHQRRRCLAGFDERMFRLFLSLEC